MYIGSSKAGRLHLFSGWHRGALAYTRDVIANLRPARKSDLHAVGPAHDREEIGDGDGESVAHHIGVFAQALLDVIEAPRELIDLRRARVDADVGLEQRAEGFVDFGADEVQRLHQPVALHRAEARHEAGIRFLVGEILQYDCGFGEYLAVVETQRRHVPFGVDLIVVL